MQNFILFAIVLLPISKNRFVLLCFSTFTIKFDCFYSFSKAFQPQHTTIVFVFRLIFKNSRRCFFTVAVFVQPIRVEGKTVAVVAFYAPDVRPRNDAMIKHARHSKKHFAKFATFRAKSVSFVQTTSLSLVFIAIRGLLEAGLSHDDTAAPFQEEDYRELVDPADNPAPVQIMNEVFGILSLQVCFSFLLYFIFFFFSN